MLSRLTSGAFIVLLIASCQAIVNGDLPAYTCDPNASNTCPPGQYCKGAGCAPCEKTDVCDGLDNDCNGTIDDGTDQDMDGFRSCGPPPIDCDDSDPTVNPNAPELCNGKDDDCDRLVDEDLCTESGSKCAPKLGKCVNNACDPNLPTSCANGTVCDPGTLECVKPAAKTIGQPCTSDTECTTGLCAGANVLAGRLGSGAVCSTTCCKSSDCLAGFVCYGAGTGGNYCLSAQALGRPAPGAGMGGASAATATECRSGLVVNGRCADTCCSRNDCAQGTSCMVGMLDGQGALTCSTTFGTGNQNADCGSSAQCSAGACASYGFLRACVMPCCGSAQCGDLLFELARCWNNQLQNGDYVSVCSQFKNPNAGMSPTGAFCTQNRDCRSERCFMSYCTDVCCVDKDCPLGMVCRPIDLQNGTGLRCVRR